MTQQQAIANCDIKALTQHLRSGIKQENIPAQLKDKKCWVVWKVENINPKTGKFSKVPYYVRTARRRSGTQGSREDRKHLATYEEVLAWIARQTETRGEE